MGGCVGTIETGVAGAWDLCREAAEILVEEFHAHWSDAWPTLESAEAEVDEAGLTNIGGVDLYPGVLEKLAAVESRGGHPMDFYQQPGFEVTGVVPDANGFGRPDILMSKRVAGPRQADAFTA
jgi:hypothetical protein